MRADRAASIVRKVVSHYLGEGVRVCRVPDTHLDEQLGLGYVMAWRRKFSELLQDDYLVRLTPDEARRRACSECKALE